MSAWDDAVEGDLDQPVAVLDRHPSLFVRGAFFEYQPGRFLRAAQVAEAWFDPVGAELFLTTSDADGVQERTLCRLPLATVLEALNLALHNER